MKAIPFVMALFSSVTLLAQQFLPVEGIVNARDLGGYEGLQVKKGQLLRAAHLANATPKDLAYLEKLGVATVVDFRKLDEKPGQYDKAVPGATYVALPIDASGSVGASATEKEKKKYMGKKAKISQTDCGYFVSTCVRASGTSGSFLALPSSSKKSYPKVPATMYIASKGGVGTLQPGDVIRYRKKGGQHVVVYIGDGKIAHASRKHAFPRVSKSKPWNNSNVKKSTIQVIRAK